MSRGPVRLSMEVGWLGGILSLTMGWGAPWGCTAEGCPGVGALSDPLPQGARRSP